MITAEDAPLRGQSVLILTGDIYEDLELWYPKLRLEEAGARVVVAGPLADTHYSGKHGYPCVSDAAIDQMHSESFDALVVPGGFMPDKLRRDAIVLDLVRSFQAASKPIAAICHGVLVLTAAGVVEGRSCSCYPACSPDLVRAGGAFVDVPMEGVHVDRNFVTAPAWPAHPAWLAAFLELLGTRIEP